VGWSPVPLQRDFHLLGAEGVELFNAFIIRKLLISLAATSAKNASLPGRRYKNGTNSAAEESHFQRPEYWFKRK
jgi:hypothetical protein